MVETSFYKDEQKLEKQLRELAQEMAMYDKSEYPAEWRVAAEKWNDLVMASQEHGLAMKILCEYGLR